MDTRRILTEYPLQVLLTVATLAALVATVVVASGGGELTTTLRLGALTFVLLLFAVGFSAGPLGERYL
ncbi:hypothetical protein [Halobaculum marinum]|uniref:Uncharacterized protein n=1 Tax=Halobaculum marinum TaxID=3031996 RepID=A0ABD5WV86_9EURY|nr:hypothetical protein [Halobaculum sp. DT55]